MIGETVPSAEATESTLSNVLKSYYQLCRTCPDRLVLTKDTTLLQTLASCVAEKNPKISLYVCKILVALSETSEGAVALSQDSNLLKSVAAACNDADLPIKISKHLMVVLSRMNRANSGSVPKTGLADNASRVEKSEEAPAKKSFFGKASKQFVFQFDHPTEAQRSQMESNCLTVRGVVSVCFQFNTGLHAKCILRCRDDVDPKTIAVQLLRTGLDVVQLSMRLADGSYQTFDYYANDESLAPSGDQQHGGKPAQLPAYLDDEEVGDPTQCVITKEQLEAQKRGAAGGGWLSALKFWDAHHC